VSSLAMKKKKKSYKLKKFLETIQSVTFKYIPSQDFVAYSIMEKTL